MGVRGQILEVETCSGSSRTNYGYLGTIPKVLGSIPKNPRLIIEFSRLILESKLFCST